MTKNYVSEVNKSLANFNVLFVKLHNYHWFVTGPHFFDLHVKFEELYTECSTHLDAVAERILTINEKPLATMKEYLAVSTVEEATGSEDTETMVKNIEKDLQQCADQMLATALSAEEAGDITTADLLKTIVESWRKHAWMLRAYLGK